MEPTSSAQFAASAGGSVPPLEQVRDDVWSLAMPMPGGHIAYSFLYLLRDAGGIHVIDPGWDSDENWSRFTDALATLGASVTGVRSIVATHLHPDHLAMADRMRSATGAHLLLHEAEQVALDAGAGRAWTDEAVTRQLDDWGVPADRWAEFLDLARRAPDETAVSADATLGDGDRLDVPGFDLVVEWTPGHTPGSICLRDDARSIMITGDHVLPTMHAGLGLGGPTATNALADYLTALGRVRVHPDHEVLPGHGYRFTGLADRAAQHADHHLRRAGEVGAALAADPSADTWTIASQLTWTAGWTNLHGFFAFSALSQTAMHRDYVLRS